MTTIKLTKEEYCNHIKELIGQMDYEYPIDWADLSVDENTITDMIVSQVVEKYDTLNKEILIASCCQLLLENFVLNLKLRT